MSKRRRVLSDTEREDWTLFTTKIEPLKRPRTKPAPEEDGTPAPKPRAKSAPPAPAPKAPPKIVEKAAPPLVPLDRREKQRVARGKIEIEGRLDLHGHTQDEAHGALKRFLSHSANGGKKMVLVITGKSGVLRRQVPLWLALPEFRALVIAADPAGVRHGGEGALYVRLRRAR